MKDTFRRKIESLLNARDYGAANKSFFLDGSPGAQLFDGLSVDITKLQTLSSTQVSGITSGREITASKTLAREALMQHLDAISHTARARAVIIPGFDEKFPLVRRVSDQALLAIARAFVRDATPVKDDFIALEMPATFLEDLEAAIAAFEVALIHRHTTQHLKASVASEIESVLEHATGILHQLHAIVRNKFRNDEARLAAWRRATHIERAHRATKAPENPPPGEPPKTSPGPEAA